MNGALDHLCAPIGKSGPGEPPEDGYNNEMTLPFMCTHDSKFESWRSEVRQATSRSRRRPILF